MLSKYLVNIELTPKCSVGINAETKSISMILFYYMVGNMGIYIRL